MRQQTRPLKEPAEKVVQDIRRATRKHYSASIAELCRREGDRAEPVLSLVERLPGRLGPPPCPGAYHNRSPRFQLRSRPASILR